jgi:fucose permease
VVPLSRGAAHSQALLTLGGRKALAGFFLSGLLFALPGAILPAWQHHVTQDYLSVGNYFLAVNVGILAALPVAVRLVVRLEVARVLALASALTFLALLALAVAPPPLPLWWRLGGMLGIGAGATLLHTAVFEAISSLYRADSAATVNLGGVFFGFGSVLIALLVAGTFYAYTVPTILLLVAVIPGGFAAMYARSTFPAAPGPPPLPLRQVARDFRSPSAVLLTLLLFFQFGNEWSIAGWLPLFLIQRLGISPESSLLLLAVYWLALLMGRTAVLAILPIVSHGKLLMANVVAALFGCVVLISTNNRFGAVMGIVLVGWGFAAVYPLVVEKIGGRFSYYHPGFFNGIFSFALTGGLLAPWSLGFFAQRWGIWVVMLLPLIGTVIVFLLLVLIWIEAAYSSPRRARQG